MPRVNSWLRAQPALHPTPAQLQGSVPGGIPRLEALSCSTDGQLCFEIWMELLPKKKNKTQWVHLLGNHGCLHSSGATRGRPGAAQKHPELALKPH